MKGANVRKIIVCVIAIAAVACGESQLAITVKELPPEAIPAGTCKEDMSGYLSVTKAGKEDTHLTDKQLGEYVRVRLSQGYSVSLYPQVSGRVFATANCHSAKP